MSRLAEVLRFAGNAQRIYRPQDERFVTLKVKGGGAVQRPTRDGKMPVPFTGYRIASGQFIYSRIDARNGAYAIVPPDLHGAVVSKDFPIFDVLTERVETRYLLHFMKAGSMQRQVQAASFGATNRQRISEEVFLDFSIPLPPLSEQRRIAAILDRADAIRTKRRQALVHLDSLIRSIFHDMFGDTGRRGRLGELAATTSGGTPDRSVAANYGGSIPWVKSGELHAGLVTGTQENITERGLASSSARLFPAGTILLAMYGATAGVVGRLGIDAATNQAICAITPGPELDAEYLVAALRARTASLVGRAAGGAQPNLSQGIVRDAEIPVPGLSDQRLFADRVRVVDDHRSRMRRALAASDTLFASLQHRAFRGEL